MSQRVSQRVSKIVGKSVRKTRNKFTGNNIIGFGPDLLAKTNS